MDWDALLKSVVVAAAISGVVATIGFWVSAATAKRINEDKLKLDKELAEQKAAAEVVPAEKRIQLDRQLSLAKRRAEVAEHVLAGFYRIKKALEAIRSPMIWANEMVPEEGVSEDVTRNDGYGVTRRVRQYSDLFSELEASRFTFGALFGKEAAAPFDQIIRIHNRIVHAAEELLRHRHDGHIPEMQDFMRAMRRDAFSTNDIDDADTLIANSLGAAIERAVDEIEKTCRPALESELAAEAAGRDV
jgi:hypothetical protein